MTWRLDVLDAGKLPDLAEALPLKAAEASAYFRHHPSYDLPTEGTVRPSRLRSKQTSMPGSNTMATGRACHWRANSIQLLRSAGRTLVASITVSACASAAYQRSRAPDRMHRR